ncbi:ABC transporter ATP-binding protein [Streptomyces sp. NBC_01443]|uniref:ABC transporter transmembrane domain-containing protein n=1 Tax=Streptomyces sp. NBC_01443 TaxID=2903868 RepID=UPI00225820C1|nr:ABC transporter ATP-binding protein [Streptomyces sp. NBC_01443]MCX4631251.1 ABC transporter ATP-binding protein/permease [Streptomyces sp. NBC_01443]
MPSNNPLPELGDPDLRSPRSYLRWLIGRQSSTLFLGVLWGCLWMASMGLTPFAIGRAIDAMSEKDTDRLLVWTGVIVGLALVTTAGSVLRHRCDTIGRLKANYLTFRLVAAQAARLGATLSKRISTGEVVAIGTSDISRIGALPGALARGIGSAVTVVLVAMVLLSTSVTLGLLVLIGVPVLLAGTGPLLRPLHKRIGSYRDLQGDLTNRAGDIVSGLRVLRGIGGEAAFGERYRKDSQRLREAGVHVAKVESVLPAAEVLLPGIFVVAVVWIGARLAVGGGLSAGELVAAYGYAAFLMLPMRTATSAVQSFVGADVAAQRVVRVLALEPDAGADLARADLSEAPDLYDAASGLRVRPGLMTAIAASTPEEGAEIAERLGRYAPGEVTVGGVPLDSLPLGQVRDLVLVARNDDTLFSGVLADDLGGRSDQVRAQALHNANAEDIVEALPDGLATVVTAGGSAFSGGQQQRLRLARALAAQPRVLVLVDPTSAVDAHTESVIAERLHRSRAELTTVVVSNSPLLLDQADEVAYVEDGKVVATGTHRELATGASQYAALVMREET